jgi:hypothetical protein
MSLLFGAGFNSKKKPGKRELGAILFDIPDVGYRVSQILYFYLISAGLME